MRIIVDIDGILCEDSGLNHWDYSICEPIWENILRVNRLAGLGHEIVLFSSRWPQDDGTTRKWLANHGVIYHELILGKPKGDFYIDDRNASLWETISLLDYET